MHGENAYNEHKPRTVNPVLCTDDLLKSVIRLGADFDRFRKVGRASWKKHEFLEGELVSSVRATVDDIKRWRRKHVWRLDARQLRKMLVQRNALVGRSSIRNCNGYAEDGVGTELALVRCAIELDQKVINLLLLRHLETRLDQCRSDCVIDVGNGLENTLCLNVSSENNTGVIYAHPFQHRHSYHRRGARPLRVHLWTRQRVRQPGSDLYALLYAKISSR